MQFRVGYFIAVFLILLGCNKIKLKENSLQNIIDENFQDSIYVGLEDNDKYVHYLSFDEKGDRLNQIAKDKEIRIRIINSTSTRNYTVDKSVFLESDQDQKSFLISNLTIEFSSSDEIQCLVSLCKPDTDYCFFYRLRFELSNGSYSIEELDLEIDA